MRRTPPRPKRPLKVIHSIEELPYLCDCSDVGLILRIYPENVAKMARDGILPGKKFGQSWRFRRDDILEYLDRVFQSDGA